MKTINLIRTWIIFVAVVSALVTFATSAEGSEKYRGDNDCNGTGNCNDIDIETNEGGQGGRGGSGGDGYGGAGGDGGESNAQGGEGGAGGDADAVVGDITIDASTDIPANTTHKARIENTPDVVTITPGSGDSCKAHIGFGVAVPGLGTSLNIPLPGKECRKLKAYDRLIAAEQWQGAEIIFCSLKEVDREFDDLELNCIDILTLYLVPGPEPVGVTVSQADYDLLVAQAEAAEAVEEYAEQSEYRYVQQQHMIEALEEDAADDDNEIERLKKRVNDEVAEADARRAAVREKIAAKEAEDDGSENPDK
jgi:hypothetical protein